MTSDWISTRFQQTYSDFLPRLSGPILAIMNETEPILIRNIYLNTSHLSGEVAVFDVNVISNYLKEQGKSHLLSI